MTPSFFFLALLGLAILSFVFGHRRIRIIAQHQKGTLHSQPRFHGALLALYVGVPPLILWGLWQLLTPLMLAGFLQDRLTDLNVSSSELGILVAQAQAVAAGNLNADFVSNAVRDSAEYYQSLQARADQIFQVIAALLIIIGFSIGVRLISLRSAVRTKVETFAMRLMLVASAVAILTTIGIIMSLIFETARFFAAVPVSEFLFGLHWSPQIAIREGQAGGSGAFGAVPLFAGTMMITLIAMCVAVPVGLLSAIYLSEYASVRMRSVIKPALEILAGIPTVVYGFFAALIVAPVLRTTGDDLGLILSSESALAAGLVMGIMIIPFVSSLSDDIINAVPQNLRDGAAALGATPSETIRQVILPAALPGIISAVLLAVSRAIGETMIVVMAAGVAANLTANPFESVTTITVQIVMLLVGDQEFDSPKTLAAFALGMVLFIATLALNVLAIYISRRYREQYD
jgi:phosphate transport system permease protein